MDKILNYVFLVVIGVNVSACSDLPRIRVLHDPLSPEEHVTLGLSYEIEGRPELAMREYDGALSQRRGYAPALIGLGNLAFARGALTEAEAYFLQALAVAPEDPGANNNLAMLYLVRGENVNEAEQLAGRALAQGGPLQPYVLDTMARIYVRQGRHREALEALNNAEALVPANNHAFHDELAQFRQELAASYPQSERGSEVER